MRIMFLDDHYTSLLHSYLGSSTGFWKGSSRCQITIGLHFHGPMSRIWRVEHLLLLV